MDGPDAAGVPASGGTVVDLEVLPPGGHLCAFHRGPGELEATAATFVRAGLAAGDRVLYVAGDRSPTEVVASLAGRGVPTGHVLGTGQLVVERFAGAYGDAGPPDLDAVARTFRQAGAAARSDGYPGLRVAAELDRLLERLGSLEEVVAWEHRATALQAEEGITSVCQYSIGALPPEDAERVAAAHGGRSPSHAPQPAATFFATASPRGLRLGGELDIANRDLLARALRARAAVAPSPTLDLEDVTFMDVGSLSVVYEIAAALPGDGVVRLRHVPERVRRTIALARLEDPRVVIEGEGA